VAATSSGLKKSTTLRELTLEFQLGATDVSPIFTSLRDHPLLRRLCLRGHAVDLTGLEALLLGDTSEITEVDIDRLSGNLPIIGLARVLQALACRPTLTKLALHGFRLNRDEARELGLVLGNSLSLQTLLLRNGALGSAELAELAPALYHNTSIKVLDISGYSLRHMESAALLRDILRNNKTITTLDLSRNIIGHRTGAVDCVVDGLGSNSTLLKIDLSRCH
jgi:hypothetical protein